MRDWLPFGAASRYVRRVLRKPAARQNGCHEFGQHGIKRLHLEPSRFSSMQWVTSREREQSDKSARDTRRFSPGTFARVSADTSTPLSVTSVPDNSPGPANGYTPVAP
jgi:hypothetical protein